MKRIAIGIGAVIIAVVGIATARRSTWHAERSLTVAASREVIVQELGDLRRWEDWTPWGGTFDPETHTSWEMAPGPGQKMAWSGPKAGTAELRLVTVVEGSGVSYARTTKGVVAQGSLALVESGERVRITWIDEGNVGWNLPARFGIGDVEDELGAAFERGLENLRGVVERRQAAIDRERQEEQARLAMAPPVPVEAAGAVIQEEVVAAPPEVEAVAPTKAEIIRTPEAVAPIRTKTENR